MKNMHFKQFVLLLMALLMLGKNAVCQQTWTFDNASKFWQEQSCIFPDKSAYITDTSNVVPPKLEQCRLLENKNISADPDGALKTKLCQTFYSHTIYMCQNTTWQSFTKGCLKPDLLQQRKPFMEKGVCTYAVKSNYFATFLSFLQTPDLCQSICGVNSMRDVCELFAFLFYQLENWKTCSEIEQPGMGKANSVTKSNHEENELTSVAQKSPTAPSSTAPSTTAPSSTAPSTSAYQTESTSTTQLTGVVSANKSTQAQKAFSTAGNNTTSTSTDNEPLHSPATKEGDLKTSGPTSEGPQASEPRKDAFRLPELVTEGLKTSQPNRENLESSTSLLISTITSTPAGETTETMPAREEEEEITTIANQSTSQEEDDDYGDNGNQKGPGLDDDQSDEILDSGKGGTAEGDKRIALGDNSETGKKLSQGVVDDDDDTESSPGSGHFLAYFLTAVVICISGYIIYHNKQKILAFIIEGRNSGRGKRQRSKDVKYTQLKSSVEEVMPSLEQTATGKNFVY